MSIPRSSDRRLGLILPVAVFLSLIAPYVSLAQEDAAPPAILSFDQLTGCGELQSRNRDNDFVASIGMMGDTATYVLKPKEKGGEISLGGVTYSIVTGRLSGRKADGQFLAALGVGTSFTIQSNFEIEICGLKLQDAEVNVTEAGFEVRQLGTHP